jgi:hypothetical protein
MPMFRHRVVGYIAVLVPPPPPSSSSATLSGWRLLMEGVETRKRGRRRIDSCAAKGTGKGSRQISRQGKREITRRGLASRAADVAGGAASSAVPAGASGARSCVPPGAGRGTCPAGAGRRPSPAAVIAVRPTARQQRWQDHQCVTAVIVLLAQCAHRLCSVNTA